MEVLVWPDYLILVAFLVTSVGIGVYHYLTGGRQKTTSEFIMANRSLKVLPTALSLMVSFQSATTILGMTAEMYSYGAQYLLMATFSFMIGIVLIMQVVVPWIYPMKLVSVNEYLARRFKSKSITILAAIASILSGIVYMGVAMYAPSAALESATGLPIVVSIPAMAIVSIAYTTLGGMSAVIWTDVFQCFIMFGGLLAILIRGLVVVGGVGNVFSLCSQTGRLDWVDWSPDPTDRHTVWGLLFGLSMAWFYLFGLAQAGVQRYSATKTLVQAKLTIAVTLPALLGLHFIVCFTGLIVVSYYASIDCDPLANHEISNANQLLPRFVLRLFADAPGFAGLFLATLYGGALSSVSSSLSGAAANCWKDILQRKLKHWTESRKVLLNRILVVVFGLAATGVAFIASTVPGPLSQITMTLCNALFGPLCGLFLLGGLNRHANWKGALVGEITSLVGSFWLTIGSLLLKRRHPTLPPLSIGGCMTPNNLTFPEYDNANSSSLFRFLDESPNDATMTYFRPLANQTMEADLQGLDKFYSISYMWYNILWMTVTVLVGSLASFLLRDRSIEEEKVDERLLISFRNFFRWTGEQHSESDPEKKCSDVNYNLVEVKMNRKGESEDSVDPEMPLTNNKTPKCTDGEPRH